MLKKKTNKKPKVTKQPYIQRLPRPFGVTQAMVLVHKSDEQNRPTLIKRANDFMVQSWLLSNGSICGKSYSISELARFLECEVSDIQLFMKDKLLSTRIWDKEVQEQMVESLLGQTVMWTLEDRMDVQSQLDLLKTSQNGKYTAFISSEVNKALKLKLDSTAAMQGLMRALSGNNTVNIFNNPVQNNQTNIQQGVNQEEALALITQAIHELPEGKKHDDLNFIEATYDVNSFPEVVATNQADINADREGLKIMKKENNKIIDNYKIHRSEQGELDMHEIRREIELEIDDDEDDPEYHIYEEV